MESMKGSKRVEMVVCKCGHTVMLILTGLPGQPSIKYIANTQARDCWSCQSAHGDNE